MLLIRDWSREGFGGMRKVWVEVWCVFGFGERWAEVGRGVVCEVWVWFETRFGLMFGWVRKEFGV